MFKRGATIPSESKQLIPEKDFGNPLILFYNKMWGYQLELPSDTPKGFEFTLDSRRYAGANAVVFHVPELTYGRRLYMPKKLRRQLWVAYSIECEENYPFLRDPRFMRRFDVN